MTELTVKGPKQKGQQRRGSNGNEIITDKINAKRPAVMGWRGARCEGTELKVKGETTKGQIGVARGGGGVAKTP